MTDPMATMFGPKRCRQCGRDHYPGACPPPPPSGNNATIQTDRIGTHGVGCWAWGPRHYECALREIERLAALTQPHPLTHPEASRHADGGE